MGVCNHEIRISFLLVLLALVMFTVPSFADSVDKATDAMQEGKYMMDQAHDKMDKGQKMMDQGQDMLDQSKDMMNIKDTQMSETTSHIFRVIKRLTASEPDRVPKVYRNTSCCYA